MLSSVIGRAKSGESDAFAKLFDISYDRIYGYIFHRVLDSIQTEDIISDVFHKAYKGIKKFRGTTEGEYYSWMFQIAYTTIIDANRSSRDIESLEEITWEPAHHENKGSQLDAKDKLSDVIEYIKTLPDREQAIITMRIWDDLSYEEISKITGESEANIRKITSRIIAKICANVSALSCITLLIHHVWKI